jgi:UDP-3-O-[3-hydroxymyristoyl] N-acetylglucosamine deacetylase
MVEHLLAALVIAGVDDVDLLLDGDEVPILDGSARGWLACLAKAEPRDADVGGTVPGRALREGAASPLPSQETHAPLRRVEAFTLDRVIRVETRGGWAEASPADRLSLDVSANFPHPAIGAQRWAGGAGDFAAELAGARTFGFLADAEALRAAGLARGASHENALVFDAEGPMTALRWPDEPVRHKALDLLGDLALLGAPLRAHVRVHHGGHALHHALVRAITEACPLAYDDHRRA